MKKLLLGLVLVVMMTGQVFAGGRMSGGYKAMQGGFMGSFDESTRIQAMFPDGLTFYKDYTTSQTGDANSLNADFSLGSPVGTFTATRTGAGISPGTYFDVDGIIKTQSATNNTVRTTYGWMDEKGFHSGYGVLFETIASTNLVTYSSDLSNSYWVLNNCSAGATVISPDGTSNAYTITTTDNTATLASSPITVTAVKGYNFSFFAKKGTQSVMKYSIYDASNSADIVAATDYTPSVSGWVRISVSFNTPVGCTSVIVKPLDNSGATGTSFIYGNQVETLTKAAATPVPAFASSYIPTNGVALTRNSETLSYALLNNFPAGNNGTIALKFRILSLPEEQITTPTYFLVQIDSNNQWKITGGTGANNYIRFDVKATSTYTATAPSNYCASWTRGSSHIIVGTYSNTADADGKKMYLYDNGLLEASSTTFSQPVGTLPANMLISFSSSQSLILEGLAIFNRAIVKSEIRSIPMNQAAEKLLLPLGDSITAGADSSDSFGYRKPLDILLTKNNFHFIGSVGNPSGYNSYQTLGSGISGDHTDDISTRLSSDLLKYFPNRFNRCVVLIHAGTNDVINGTPEATTVSRIQTMIDNIVAVSPNISIYIAKIIPTTDAGNDIKTTSLNAAIATMVIAYQATKSNLYLIDQNAAFKADANWAVDYMTNSVHPNDAGYQVMANTWYAAMVANGDI